MSQRDIVERLRAQLEGLQTQNEDVKQKINEVLQSSSEGAGGRRDSASAQRRGSLAITQNMDRHFDNEFDDGDELDDLNQHGGMAVGAQGFSTGTCCSMIECILLTIV